MNQWRVLQCYAGSEFDVAARALADGVQAYCPTFAERRLSRYNRRGEPIVSEIPMFKGYLFANFAAKEQAGSTFNVHAYVRALGPKGQVVKVLSRTRLSDAQIEAIRATSWLMTSISDRATITRGAVVDIWRGILRGQRAQVLKVRGQRAAISLLGSGAVLLIDTSDLENVPRVAI